MRINKFLAAAGLGARRKVEQLIKDGKIEVNDSIVTNFSTDIDPKKDIVKVNGKVVSIESKVYIILNKPLNVLTAASDNRGRKTVIDLVSVEQRIFPVGRLDFNSRGLIILTNDGDLMANILHPRHKISKVYVVKSNAALSKEALTKFRQGIVIDGKRTASAKINPLPPTLNPSSSTSNFPLRYEVSLTEGRKRQIRRMFEVLGYKVLDLKRIQIGPIKLGDLKEGQWRYLTETEHSKLLQEPEQFILNDN